MPSKDEHMDRSARARQASAKRIRKNRDPRKGHPTTSDMDYTPDEVEFIMAMDAFKTKSGRQFPTWSDAFRVLISLGYQKQNPRLFVPKED